MSDHSTTLTEDEIRSALRIAGDMIDAGIPVFAAPPCRPGCGLDAHPKGSHHYKLPTQWQMTFPTRKNLEKWQPGWALGAVGGHVADFLDVDPRAGGDVAAEEVRGQGEWPRVFGRQRTPSGGYHEIITCTGERTLAGRHAPVPGVDLQAGTPEGNGRGFVFIAPTVKPSKETGELLPYRWEESPDLESLAEWRGTDDSIQGIVSRVHAKRARVPTPRAPTVDNPDDPFLTQSTAHAVSMNDVRRFTMGQAQDFVRPSLLALRAAQVGEIEETANTAAARLSHFVPAFWGVDEAFRLLTDALAHTAYDPDRPGAGWRAEKFRSVLDGTRPPLDPWKAVRAPEPPPPPSLPTPPGQEGASTLDRLRARVQTAQEMSDNPNPVPLIHGLLDMNSESWGIGAPGSFKSFVALDWAGHVGLGRDWQGHRVRKGRVLYVAAEGVKGMTLRTRAWIKVHGAMEDVFFLPYPVQVQSADGQWEALTELAREIGPALIVIDTQHRVTAGIEENSASGIGILTLAVSMLREATGACVLVMHHTGRNGQDARGSNAIDAAQDTELKVVRDSPREALSCHIRQDKQKDMAEGASEGIPIRFQVVDLGIDPETGRELSSLVMLDRDDFANIQGVDVDLTRPWLPTFGHRDRWRKTIINALWDFAPEGDGITKAEVRAILVRDARLPERTSAFADAWKSVVELRDPAGDPVVERIRGERFNITSLPVIKALEEEHGARGSVGQGGVPTTSGGDAQ